jgi:flagellar protein FlgJ
MNINAYHSNPEIARGEKISSSEEERLREACQGFEAIFLHQMLKSMRAASTSMEGELFKKSNAEKIFTDMLDQQYAENMSKNSVGGLADVLFEQLRVSLQK